MIDWYTAMPAKQTKATRQKNPRLTPLHPAMIDISFQGWMKWTSYNEVLKWTALPSDAGCLA